MDNLNVQNKKNADIKNFTSLAQYIRYQKLLQSDNDKNSPSQLNDIDHLKINGDEKNSNSKKIIPKNDKLNSFSDTIEETINQIEKMSLEVLKTDESLKEFKRMKLLDSISGKSFSAQVFHNNIKSTEQQFALIEYALKNGQDPMDLFDINLNWMGEKLKTNKITLNGKEIKLQKKNKDTVLFRPRFYLKCEFVFNLFCLYSGENLFDLFSAEEIIRQFEECADKFVKFCYDKKCGKEKNGFEILYNQLEKEFESIGKRYGITGGLLGILFSFLFICIIANIVATLSPWILVIIPFGTLTGYLVGKIKKIKRHIEVLNLLNSENSKNNVSSLQQTFEVFKKQYESFEPIPPGGSEINESNVQPEQAKLNLSEEKN